MTGNRIRSQVDWWGPEGARSVAITVPSWETYPAEVREMAEEVLGDLVARAAEELGLHPERVVEFLAAEVTLRIADGEAYRREADRRGVLAL